MVNSVLSIINIEQISKIKGGKENQVGNSQDFYQFGSECHKEIIKFKGKDFYRLADNSRCKNENSSHKYNPFITVTPSPPPQNASLTLTLIWPTYQYYVTSWDIHVRRDRFLTPKKEKGSYWLCTLNYWSISYTLALGPKNANKLKFDLSLTENILWKSKSWDQNEHVKAKSCIICWHNLYSIINLFVLK